MSIGLLAFQRVPAAQPLPRSVLLLDQSDPHAPWGINFRARFRAILAEEAIPIAVYTELPNLGRFDGPEHETHLRNYLAAKYRDKPIGVLVASGAKMFEIALRLRNDLWPSVPLVFATIHPSTIARLNVPENVTGATIQLSLHSALAVARSVVPDLKRIVHVGSRWEHQPFFRFLAQEWPELAKQVEVENLAGLSLQETKNRVSALPNDSAIIYTSMYADDGGASSAPINALAAVAEVANRPIVGFAEPHIGAGATGGSVLTAAPAGADAATRVLRILGGESASNIPITVGDFTRTIFDWRQLQRFGVDERRLPADSEIRFRPATVWEQYRWQMITIFFVILSQTIMILGLLVERHRRQAAESTSRRRLLEVNHLNRVATASVMSASIAHELNQPLGAILANTEAAKILLAVDSPDTNQIREIVEDIHRDDQRAAEIIKRLGRLLKRKEIELQDFDLREIIANTLDILEPEAAKRDIKLISRQSNENVRVRADQVHLQQVLLNLAINGMDAVQSSKKRERELTFEAAINGNSEVEVSISDSGDGIPSEKLERVFETFFTTKPQGTGLGLSITRTIIEIYGGKIWAENGASGGAMFRFTLPRVQGATL